MYKSRIYKETQVSEKKETLQKKTRMTKDLNRHFQKKVSKWPVNMKMYTVIKNIRKMQIERTRTPHLITMAKIQNSNNLGEDLEELELTQCW